MPARRELTPQEALRRAERKRESDRLAAQRYRARVSLTRQTDESPRQTDGALNGAHTHEGAPARSTSFSLLPPSTTPKKEEDGGGGDLTEVLAVLAPFGSRGDVPTRRYLERLHQECPQVDLVAVALEAAQWLCHPEHLTRECSNAFLGRWVRKNAAHGAPQAATTGADPVVETDPERAALRRLVEGGARSAVGRAVEMYLEHPPEAPSTWRH